MHSLFSIARWRRAAAVAVVAVAATVLAVIALGTGRSFTSLASGYEQELYGSVQLGVNGSTPISLGGVAFASNGDVWAAECRLSGPTRLHRFDAAVPAPSVNGTTTRHATTVVEVPVGFCGLTNHPDGFLYANSLAGVHRLDASTGAVAAWPDGQGGPRGTAGNGLGITVDPLTGTIVYTSADCVGSSGAARCTIARLDPATGTPSVFGGVSGDHLHTDALAFDPSGEYLFAASRRNVLTHLSRVSILRRPATAGAEATLVQNVPTQNKVGGLAFHAASGAVVTNDEANGTMTWYAFAGGYASGTLGPPLASGGFRGSALTVGEDACMHVTQGRRALAPEFGTRYDDGTRTTEDSIVRVCGGFVPSPGVVETLHPTTCTSTIGDFVWLDTDADGIQDAGEPGVANVTVRLRDGDGDAIATAITDTSGFYELDAACDGVYTVEVDTPVGHAPAAIGVGSPDTDSSPSPTSVATASDGTPLTSIDFGFVLGGISGTVFVDDNGNGTRDPDEAGLAGVTVALNGAPGATATSGADGVYEFSGLLAGAYQVAAPEPAAGLALGTPTPLAALVAAGQDVAGLDFGYVAGRIAGMAFVDGNGNGLMDAGEPGLGGVEISLGGASSGVTQTATSGGFAFGGLGAGGYTVAAPDSIGGMSRDTDSPIEVTLTAGQVLSDIHVGYQEAESEPVPDPETSAPVPSRTVRLAGWHWWSWVLGLDETQHLVTVRSEATHTTGVDVWVNGQAFRVRNIRGNETRTIDVASAMRPGGRNWMLVMTRGPWGSQVLVTVGGTPATVSGGPGAAPARGKR
jgi:hypothetical protein